MSTDLQTTQTEINNPERLYFEINLLRLQGIYFCLDPKEAKSRTGKQTIQAQTGDIEQTITVEPHPTYGYPSVLAYKVLKAILNKFSGYSYPFPESIPFGARELARAIDRKGSGRDIIQIENALRQLQNTLVQCKFFNKKTKKWKRAEFKIITTILSEGEEDRAEHYSIYLEPKIVESFNQHHMISLNYDRMKTLKPLGSILFEQLFYRFSNQYNGHNSDQIVVKKDYEKACLEWLGGIKPKQYKSDILNSQLGSHISDVKKTGITKNITLEKNASGTGYNIEARPGKAFFQDYDRFYTESKQPKLDFKKAADESEIVKPMEVVAYFYQKLHGVEKWENPMSKGDTDYARELLDKYSFEEVRAFVDKSLKKAKKTCFDIQSFRGLKTYQPAFDIALKKLKEKQERDKIREKKEKEQAIHDRLWDQYRSYKVQLIEECKSSLPKKQRTQIEDELREEHEYLKTFPDSIGLVLDGYIEEKLLTIQPFEEWKKRQK